MTLFIDPARWIPPTLSLPRKGGGDENTDVRARVSPRSGLAKLGGGGHTLHARNHRDHNQNNKHNGGDIHA